MTDKVCVTFLFFAKARELVGLQEDKGFIDKNNNSVEELIAKIINLYEVLEPLAKSLLIAVNEEYVVPSQNVCLKDGDIVAVMPPLSGG